VWIYSDYVDSSSPADYTSTDTSVATTPEPSNPSSKTLSTPKSPTISSAPLIPDFIPPVPSPQDPYPGYYQLPNKTWQAYEPAYYHSFFPESASESVSKRDDGRVGHHWDDYETFGGGEGMVEISANEGLEEARRERERQDRMVKPKLPGEDFEYKASSPTHWIKKRKGADMLWLHRLLDRSRGWQRNDISCHPCLIALIRNEKR
jgi:hypothetical protein